MIGLEQAVANLTIVFIHGTPGRAGVWREQFAHPFPNADLIAYDRPGFGASTPIARHPHLDQQVGALTNLLAAAAITNRVLLVGHSYGGTIALLAAIKHPDRIAGTLLIGGDVSPKLEEMLWIQYAGGKTNLFARLVLPGANHFIPGERPGDVATGIDRLIQLTEQRGQRAERDDLQQGMA